MWNKTDGVSRSMPLELLENLILTAQVALCLFGVVANTLIIVAIGGTRHMHTTSNFYVACLSVADLFYATTLGFITVNSLVGSWVFGPTLCRAYYGLDALSKTAGVLFIALLAYDRYSVLCRRTPVIVNTNSPENRRRAIVRAVATWLLGLLIASPLVAYAEERPLREHDTMCVVHWPYRLISKYYVSVYSLGIYVLPMLLITFCYANVVGALRGAARNARRFSGSKHSTDSAPTPSASLSNAQQYMRVTRAVIACTIFYVVCWSPYWLYNIFSTFWLSGQPPVGLKRMLRFVHLLPYVNSALNPLLYTVINSDFKNTVLAKLRTVASIRFHHRSYHPELGLELTHRELITEENCRNELPKASRTVTTKESTPSTQLNCADGNDGVPF